MSEAYFARLLGLPFIAVMPSCTAKRKIEQIEFYGGRCHFVASACEIYAASETLARELNGHYMDQFTLPSGRPTGEETIILPTASSVR